MCINITNAKWKSLNDIKFNTNLYYKSQSPIHHKIITLTVMDSTNRNLELRQTEELKLLSSEELMTMSQMGAATIAKRYGGS